MTKKTTKIFINDKDTFFYNEDGELTQEQRQDTVSGYFNSILTDEDTNERTQLDYFINTARPLVERMGDWKDRYNGSLSSFKKHEKVSGGKLACGNIVKSINGGKGKAFIACFIAFFDYERILFEVHYPTMKGVFYVDDVVMKKRNEHEQLQTELLTMSTEPVDVELAFPQLQTIKGNTKRRANAKLSLRDEDDILHALKMGNRQADIATRHGITQSRVSKLKATFKREGKL